ncbi:MAG: hypothetical protein A2Z20_09955 [Bdellovibrionales bacterium RBG_16_40_8]|nr:MAG: hypothetical protein A2Z20_09955 [Bdellovibrionales bacterium RBG_16_40_8]
MQTTEFSEKVALFYYFSFLDESRAQLASALTLKKIRQENITQKKSQQNLTGRDLVRITNNMSKKLGRDVQPTSLAFSAGHIVLPKNSNWGPWFEFRKVANEKEFSAVLYARILKISDSEIAEGLNTSLGTVQYRIGRGLKTLGGICVSGRKNAK